MNIPGKKEEGEEDIPLDIYIYRKKS